MGIVQLARFGCDDCGKVLEVGSSGIEMALRSGRARGWAIARDRNTCYCPACAAARRSVGRGGSAALKEKLTGIRKDYPGAYEPDAAE